MPAGTYCRKSEYARAKTNRLMEIDYPPILETLGHGCPVSFDRVGGGCIANAGVAEFADGSKVFLKSLEGVPGMFECEAGGLRALAAAGAIRVPEVLAVDRNTLVLEYIQAAPGSRIFFESFGRSFARLHDCRGPCAGFPQDNFIGSTPQVNSPIGGSWEVVARDQPDSGNGSDWAEFFLERRLRFQVGLAVKRRHGHELAQLLEGAETRILDLLASAPEPPSLLHGDLWSGNFIVDEKGEACLIDPAVYYGHREADLAMTRLFGGFDECFYEAYNEVLPVAPGHVERLGIYQLYHLLNHLNLFGSAYFSQCLQILRRYSG